MRRITAGCAFAALFTLTVLSSMGADKAAAPAKSKIPGKAAKVSAPATYGNAESISEAELKVYLYFLASDQLEGRNIPSRGYDVAALYVASHLAEWGLKPGGSAEGTNGPLQPYFMPMEMAARQIVPEESKVSLTAPAPAAGRGGMGGGAAVTATAGGARGETNAAPQLRTTSFDYGKDWSAGAAAGGRGAAPNAFDVSANLVFAGNGYVIEKTKTNPYEGLDVKGKIIVVAGLPAELAAQQAGGGRGGRAGGAATPAGQPAQPAPAAANAPAGAQSAAAAPAGRGAAAANPLGENCKDYYSPEAYAAKNGALAVVNIANFQTLSTMGNAAAGAGRASLNGPNFQVVRFQTPPACAVAPSVTAGLDLTTALFQGERVSGSQVFYATGSTAKLDSFELNARKKLSVKLGVKTDTTHGENVIGMVEGSDPVLKNEYVVVSAHLDHLGLSAPLPDGHSVFNGADDDGSGSTGLLAMARSYAEGAAKGMRPKRTMIFLWMGGEEKGLWGSQYFTQFPPVDLSKVVADLNMDMIGRSKSPKSVDTDPTHVLVDPGEILVVGPNISSDDMEKTIETVNDSYLKLKLNHFYDTTAPDATHDNLGPQPNGQRIFYRSDHYNYAKVGIPIAFFTTGLHVDYHRATDTPDKIDYKEMQQVTRTMAAIGWELANQAGRPKLNAKLPDQLVKDMQTAKTAGWGKLTPVLAPLPGMPY